MTSGVFTDPAELSNHLTFDREIDAAGTPVHGNVYFSAKHVPADPQGSMSRVRADHYARPAIVPAMDWLPVTTVRAPVLASASRDGGGVALQWLDASAPEERATSFAVYRAAGAADSVDIEDASNLIATRRAEPGVRQSFVDASAETGAVYSYAVTALDRVWNESGPSRVRTAR